MQYSPGLNSSQLRSEQKSITDAKQDKPSSNEAIEVEKIQLLCLINNGNS
jgi:hypothetical protein